MHAGNCSPVPVAVVGYRRGAELRLPACRARSVPVSAEGEPPNVKGDHFPLVSAILDGNSAQRRRGRASPRGRDSPASPAPPGELRPRPASPVPGAWRDPAPLPPTSFSSPALPPPVPGCQHHESGRRQARSEAPEEQAGRRPRQHRRAGTQRRHRRAGQGRGCGGSGPRPAGRGGRPADSSGRRQRSPGRRRGRGGTRRGERGRGGHGDIAHPRWQPGLRRDIPPCPRAAPAPAGSRGWAPGLRGGGGGAGAGQRPPLPTLCGGRAAPAARGRRVLGFVLKSASASPAAGSHLNGGDGRNRRAGLEKAKRHLHYALFAVANFVIQHRRFIVAWTVVGTLVPWNNSDLLHYFILW